MSRYVRYTYLGKMPSVAQGYVGPAWPSGPQVTAYNFRERAGIPNAAKKQPNSIFVLSSESSQILLPDELDGVTLLRWGIRFCFASEGAAFPGATDVGLWQWGPSLTPGDQTQLDTITYGEIGGLAVPERGFGHMFTATLKGNHYYTALPNPGITLGAGEYLALDLWLKAAHIQ